MSSSVASPAGTSRDTSRDGLQKIEPVPSIFFDDLCLSRPDGLPIIKDLSPTDAVVFNYGYQAQYPDDQVVPPRGTGGSERRRQNPGTKAKDKQPATPPTPSQAMFHIMPLGKIPTDSRGGEYGLQIQYIQTFALEDIEAWDKKLFDPSSAVLYSPELFRPDGAGQPINAVRIRAKEGSHNIFVGLPYLGYGPKPNDNRVPQDENVLKLPRLDRGSNGSAEEPDYEMCVWQSWQILFDNTRLALIKSPNSPSPNCAPLFGHQPTFGPLHALALIIGNLFRHEVQPLEVLRAEVGKAISHIEMEISKYVSLEPDELTKDARSDYRGKMKGSNVLLERYILNTKTIIVMLRKQLSILRDLKTITGSYRRTGVQLQTLTGNLTCYMLSAYGQPLNDKLTENPLSPCVYRLHLHAPFPSA